MFLSNLKLWNFRKYGSEGDIDLAKADLDIDFHNGLNLMIGENDVGKSSIVDAIKIVLKTTSNDWVRVVEQDFHSISNDLRIELVITDLEPDEACHFNEYFTVKTKGSDQIIDLRLIFTATRRDGKIRSSDVRAGSDITGRILPSDVRDYLKVTYLRPLRDAESELIPKRNSRLSQILNEHDAFKNREEHVLLALYKDFNESIENYFEGKSREGNILTGDQNGKLLKDSIDQTVKQFFDETSTTALTTSTAQLKKVLESLELTLSSIENPGLGSLNRLFMASELIHLNKENWTGLRLGLVEEIEAHLHPQIQLKVIKSLVGLERTQLLLTTHSPNLASKVPLKNQIICRNNNAFPMSEGYTNLSEGQYVFLDKFLDVTKSSLFFAKGLILVEGWSEELLVPIIAERLGYDLIDKEVTVINVGNLGFENYYKIFSRADGKNMNINISVITDCDFAAYVEKIDNSIKVYEKVSNEAYLLGCQEASTNVRRKYDDPVKAFVAEEWTLEWCLMKSSVLGTIFKEVVEDIHPQGDWENIEKQLAEKLLKKTLNKSETAYQIVLKLNKEYADKNLAPMITDPATKHIVEAIKYACRE